MTKWLLLSLALKIFYYQSVCNIGGKLHQSTHRLLISGILKVELPKVVIDWRSTGRRRRVVLGINC